MKINSSNNKLIIILAALPGIGITVLLKLFCPVCWPMYSTLLSAFGLTFIDYEYFILPVTVIYLLIIIFSLSHISKKINTQYPFIIGILISTIILIGKFIFEIDYILYIGTGLLVLVYFISTLMSKSNIK